VLPEYPTRAEAQAIAHPWEPVAQPVYRKVIRAVQVPHVHTAACDAWAECPSEGLLEEQPTESFEEIEDAIEHARSDGKGYLGVVSKTWTPVTNGEMYDIAEVIEGVDKGAVRYETGGSLLGGRKVWLLLRLAEPIQIVGDPHGEVIPYYALQNAHDGSGSFRGQATFTRVVCDNTAKAADLDAQTRGTEFVFSHTKNVKDRIEEAKKALAGWRTSVSAFQDQATHLMSLGIDVRQRELFLEKFVPMPSGQVISDRVARNIDEARNAVRTILKGSTCEGIDKTAWGLVQGSVEYLNHVRKAHSQESRFKRAYLDRSEITAHAVKLALEAAHA
jgi:phage/plasmid-like protein (TIGR03299 family)